MRIRLSFCSTSFFQHQNGHWSSVPIEFHADSNDLRVCKPMLHRHGRLHPKPVVELLKRWVFRKHHILNIAVHFFGTKLTTPLQPDYLQEDPVCCRRFWISSATWLHDDREPVYSEGRGSVLLMVHSVSIHDCACGVSAVHSWFFRQPSDPKQIASYKGDRIPLLHSSSYKLLDLRLSGCFSVYF